MSYDHRQSPLKALLNTFGICHKTHGMKTRNRSKDKEDISDIQDPTPLDFMPEDHHVLEGDNDSSDEYCEEINTHCPLADLLEQFQWLKNNLQVKNLTLPNPHLQKSGSAPS